jgi:hypothetical protein
MALTITHNFVSAILDDATSTSNGEVLPSHWNDDHVVSGSIGVANGGTGTTTTFTQGSVVFAGSSGVYTQDNAKLFWDDTNNRLGIGTSSPQKDIDVVAGGAYGYDGAAVIRAQVSKANYHFGPSGNLSISGVGDITIGKDAGVSLTSGNSNFYAGDSAGFSQTSGHNNFGMGASAQYWIQGGGDNIAIGQGAGSSGLGVATNVNGDVYIGSFAGENSANGFNVGIGFKAGRAITSGFGNVVLGSMHVGNTGPTTGSQNILIGVGNNLASQTGSGQLTIGEFIYGTGLTGFGGSISGGMIGLGVKAPATELEVAGRIKPGTYTVATLPTGVAGATVYVTDGDAALAWGATVINSGAGATKYLVWYNGSNWTVVGK